MANYVFNPLIKKKLDLVAETNNATITIPQYNSDPASPTPEEVWVLKTGGGTPTGGGIISAFIGGSMPYPTVSSGGGVTGGGDIIAFLGGGLPFPSKGTTGSSTYQLSYRTLEGTTKRVTLG